MIGKTLDQALHHTPNLRWMFSLFSQEKMPQWHHSLPWNYAKDILETSEGSLLLCGSLLLLSWSQELEAYSVVQEMEKMETLLD